MMTFFLWLFLLLSIAANALLIWYIKQVIRRVWDLSENMDEIVDLLAEYNSHIETVYEMETYHGDVVIKNLLKHSKEVTETLKAYIDAREIVREDPELELDDDE